MSVINVDFILHSSLIDWYITLHLRVHCYICVRAQFRSFEPSLIESEFDKDVMDTFKTKSICLLLPLLSSYM